MNMQLGYPGIAEEKEPHLVIGGVLHTSPITNWEHLKAIRTEPNPKDLGDKGGCGRIVGLGFSQLKGPHFVPDNVSRHFRLGPLLPSRPFFTGCTAQRTPLSHRLR